MIGEVFMAFVVGGWFVSHWIEALKEVYLI